MNLKSHLHKFNGKKIINVNYENYEFAKHYLEKNFSDDVCKDIEFIFTKNHNNNLYEINPFMRELLPRTFSLNEKEYTFYGHTKGVSKYNNDTANFSKLLWAYTMYNRNLENFDLIDSLLQTYSCCGTLKVDRVVPEFPYSQWHYSGTFFWFKNSSLYSGRWTYCSQSLFGVEAYLGMHIDTTNAYCIGLELQRGADNPYLKETWDQITKGF